MSRLTQLLRPFTVAVFMVPLISCGTMPDTSTTPDVDSVTASNSVKNPATTANTEAGGAIPGADSRDTYVIQPGDVLTISVWKEKDLQGEYAVRPDGGLNFPLVGEIVAAGKTIEQLKSEIATRLARYVPDPVVTATVKNSLGNKIYVIGKVNKPGEYITNRTVDVMQALSMAGGPNPFAAVNKIKILRRINGEQKTFLFKYSQVEKGKNLEQNITLQGGDVVVVP